MRVVMLTSVHPVGDTRIVTKEAETLAAAGHDVLLVAPHDHVERIGLVNIHPVLRRRTRTSRMVLTTFDVLRAALSLKGDVYHFHDPELIPTGLVLKLMRKKVVYDIHEDVPAQILTKSWIPSKLRPLIAAAVRRIEDLSARRFDALVIADPPLLPRFTRHRPHVVRLVENLPLLSEVVSETDRDPQPNQFAYVGRVAEIRGAKEMVEALELLGGDARLALAGPAASQALLDRLNEMPGWPRVSYSRWLNRQDVRSVLTRSIAGLVVLHPVPNYVAAQPTKMFEYMAAGLPVIASDFPYWRGIVERADCGLLVDPLNVRAIEAAMRWIVDNPSEAQAKGDRGRRLVMESLNWDRQGAELIALYDWLGEASKARIKEQRIIAEDA